MKYFYYELNALGQWSGRISPDYPMIKGPEGQKRSIQQITELPEEHQDTGIGILERLYPHQTDKDTWEKSYQ